jgi:SecD/SecF fusion protein
MLWFAISGAVVVISVVSLGVRGLNLGIDFKGGTQITFSTPTYVNLDAVRGLAGSVGEGKAQIQGRGDARGDSYRSFQIRTESLAPTAQSELTRSLNERFARGNQELSINVRNVSSSFGRQIARLAIVAILVSLILIVIYVAIRFGFKFSVPVVIALIHDVVITVGIYSLTGREVSTSTVAAVLTVLGYSIYDTIIIFDRIRENQHLMTRSSFARIANVSLWETIPRSLATTFITLLPVASLYVFGGETLQDFAFALLVGIGAGAYSSIFIAAPLLTLWKNREPEWRRRQGMDVGAGVGGAAAALAEAEKAAADEPAPHTIPVLDDIAPVEPEVPVGDGDDGKTDEERRARRQQRRRARPHGRAR